MQDIKLDPLQTASDRFVEVLAMLEESKRRIEDMRSLSEHDLGVRDCARQMTAHLNDGINLTRSYLHELSRRQRIRDAINNPKPPPWMTSH